MATPNYVKFIRGTPTAFSNLQVKDPDTLYFISEKGAEAGILYLGTKIIAGGGGGVISVTSVADLTDVLLSNDIADDSLLVYDQTNSKWVNKTVEEVFNIIVPVMTGATADEDGKSGLVPVPLAGQQDMFLKANGTWSNDVGDLKAVVGVIIGKDEGMSARDVAESVFETYVGDLDSLKEIMDWLNGNPDFTDFNKRLNTVEGTLFDQGTVDTGDFKAGLVTVVGNLQLEMADVTQEINNIYERLTWQEMNDITTG